MEHLKWIWQYLKKRLNRFIPGLCVSFAVALMGLINPYVSGRIIGSIQDGTWKEALGASLAILVGATLLRAIARYAMLLIFETTSQMIVLDLRQDIYAWVHSQNYSFFDSNRVGDIMARMTGDLDAVRHFTSYVIYAVFENAVVFVGAVSLMMAISWQLTLMMLLVAPVIFISAVRQSREVKPAFFNVREQFSKLNSVCEENIGGNRVVKACAKEDYEILKFTQANQAFYDANVASANIWVKYLPIMEFCAGLLSFFLLLAGGIMVILEKLELWQMVAINGYLWAVNNPLRMLGWLINDVQNFFASADKIFNMIRKKIYIKNPERPVHSGKLLGKVEFKEVSFGYDKNNPKALALRNLSFTAKPGSSIGIVGATGAGKTTLANLIGRFYDASLGEVLVDGVNVKDYDLVDLRRGIAYAAQDVFLFSDTVEGNIAYGAPEIGMEKVVDAAKTACADSFIRSLENGYDTIVGERGVGLSGGQKQRLSLARALAADPSILILDDTSSAVDMETEHDIQVALKEKFAGRTTFIIAHRISSVRNADLILVLDSGAIAESGTHEELMGRKGYYWDLYASQYGADAGRDF
ncbi:MAG: ABC transporter ATP-binding protein/permease [Clostridiales bacterium]|jgi:ATP-binding cassette subfamily B protein|nr:ABC transporter ATP-binding protein/permease [Clostridiales bacterium]